MFEFLQYQVEDVMTPDPVTVTPQTHLRELEALFESHDFNGVPVVGGDHHLRGVVTKYDLLRAFAFSTRSIVPHYDEIMEQTAESVMTPDPITVEPDMPLSRLLQLLLERHNKSFPVTHEGRLVGIVAREDVLKALRRATQHGEVGP